MRWTIFRILLVIPRFRVDGIHCLYGNFQWVGLEIFMDNFDETDPDSCTKYTDQSNWILLKPDCQGFIGRTMQYFTFDTELGGQTL